MPMIVGGGRSGTFSALANSTTYAPRGGVDAPGPSTLNPDLTYAVTPEPPSELITGLAVVAAVSDPPRNPWLRLRPLLVR